MASNALALKPVKNWKKERAEWLAALEQLMNDAETWARENDWVTRRDTKTIQEEQLGGEFEVPVLKMQSMQHAWLLEPIARFVSGGRATGLVDLTLMPFMDRVLVVRHQDGAWKLIKQGRKDLIRAWNKKNFTEMAN